MSIKLDTVWELKIPSDLEFIITNQIYGNDK